MSVSTTLAPSRTNRCAAAPPKPIRSPLIAAAAPVSSATLPSRRILASLRRRPERSRATLLLQRDGWSLRQGLSARAFGPRSRRRERVLPFSRNTDRFQPRLSASRPRLQAVEIGGDVVARQVQ